MNITPIKLNLQKLVISSEQVTWNPHKTNQRQGADISILYETGEQSIALVRFQPGASAKPHLHNCFESIYVISGSYSDDNGNYSEGDLIIYPDKSIHAWSSKKGALLYVVWGGKTSVVC